MHERPRTTSARVPALDGLRGVAILLVMMIHFAQANPRSYHWANHVLDRFFRVGWIGVDLFFVLSGYLITGILCDARDTAHYFRNFYMRRVLRIFPLYYVFLTLVLVVLPHLAGPRIEVQNASESAVWYWTYLVNVRTAQGGWLDAPVGHFWSLAVEEQFYVVWPLLILLFDRRAMIWCAFGLVASAVALRVVLHSFEATTAAYVLTPARFDALAIGGLLALVARNPLGLQRVAAPMRILGWICATAIGVIALSYGRLHPEDQLVGTVGYTLLAGMFGSLLVSAVLASPSSVSGRIWSSSVLAFFGRYSYALYVVHPAVIYFWPGALSARQWWTVTGNWFAGYLIASLLMGGTSVLLALLSWHALEKHFLRLQRRFPYGRSESPETPAKTPIVGSTPAIIVRAGEGAG